MNSTSCVIQSSVYLWGILAQFWPNKHFSHFRPFSSLIVNSLTNKTLLRGDMMKRAEKWPVIGWWWHHPRNSIRGGLDIVTDKTKNKTAVRFKPRSKAHGYSRCPTALLLLFLSFCERSARETWHSYRRHLLLHNNRLPLRETWLSPFSIWRCYVTKGWYWEKRQ